MTKLLQLLQVLHKTRRRALAFTAFVALVWLNQSVGSTEWEAIRDRTFAAPADHVLDLIQYPFVFLYRRSGDEEIYFATASATLGLPYDTAVFAQRGDSPLPRVTTPVDGRFHLPYAEIPFEYPPPNVPFVLMPRLVVTRFRTYAWVFGATMGLLLVASAWIAARLGANANANANADADADADQGLRIFVFGLLLLAHGAIAIQRLDAVVALLVILMVRAAIRGDDKALGFWGGLVGAAKLVPILLLPALLVATGIRDAKRLGTIALGAAVGLALGLGPMLVLGRESLPLLISYHSARGLHVESSLGVVYGAVKAMLGMREASLVDYGSFNFHGAVSQLLAKASAVVTLVLVGVVVHASHAGRAPHVVARESKSAREDESDQARAERIVLTALGTLIALWLGGKVFSPQYLTWALPLAIAVPGRSWLRVSLALGTVLVMSQVYLRGFYDHVYNQWPAGVLTMVARLIVLIAFLVVVIRRLRGDATSRPLSVSVAPDPPA